MEKLETVNTCYNKPSTIFFFLNLIGHSVEIVLGLGNDMPIVKTVLAFAKVMSMF